jgi:hypothetical protein
MAFKPRAEKEKGRERKSLFAMTIDEIRNELESISFDIGGKSDRNAFIMRHWIGLNPHAFREWYQAHKSGKGAYSILEAAGAMRDGAVLIPNGWEQSPILYDVINLKIEEMHRVEYAKGKELAVMAEGIGEEILELGSSKTI